MLISDFPFITDTSDAINIQVTELTENNYRRAECMLERINKANDVKQLDEKELDVLCKEIREKIIFDVSKNGGHLGSNLGLVETTVALHRVLDLPQDKIIFDVGHQCYTHKLLTGRKDMFSTLRKKDGISGFTNRFESECDTFTAGHSGPSVSAGFGLANNIINQEIFY